MVLCYLGMQFFLSEKNGMFQLRNEGWNDWILFLPNSVYIFVCGFFNKICNLHTFFPRRGDHISNLYFVGMKNYLMLEVKTCLYNPKE